MAEAMVSTSDRTGPFERLRPRLFGIAYRMLGTVQDAEDVLQEAYLRWHLADADAVRNPEAWLIAITTRLSIDALRRAAVEGERDVGVWLPEPIATDALSVADRRAEVASDLSVAFLVLLERLAPEERAAFLLREVFDAGYDEIARVLERSEAACRQLVHRARERVRGDRARVSAPPDAQERLVGRFLEALAAEDERALLALFSDDVLWVSDGGGKTPAVRKVVTGAERVAKLVVGYQRKGRGLVTHRVASINGEPAILTLVGDRTVFTTSLATDGERVTAVYRVLNPDKLGHVGPPPFLGGS